MREPFAHVYPDLEERLKDTLQWRFLNLISHAGGDNSRVPSVEEYTQFLRNGTMHMHWYTAEGTVRRWYLLQKCLHTKAVACPERLVGYWVSFMCITGHGPNAEAVLDSLGKSQWCEEDPMNFWAHIQEELERLAYMVGNHV